MEFFETLQARQSIRAFSQESLEPELVGKILEAINSAPSAGNLQAFEVYLVTSNELRRKLAKTASDQAFLAQAPAVLVFCAHPARSQGRYGERGAELYSLQDATIACTYAMLAATALGLSSVWVGAFEEKEVGRVLGLPGEYRTVALLPVGKGAESPPRPSRRNPDEIIHRI